MKMRDNKNNNMGGRMIMMDKSFAATLLEFQCQLARAMGGHLPFASETSFSKHMDKREHQSSQKSIHGPDCMQSNTVPLIF